ncbi:ABC transporter B family member 11 [Verticillium dahliae VDG1]|nr:ABC transporter B family member 11 [Verticillium dahliae VDG1]
MEGIESPVASSESGTFGPSPAQSHLNQSRKRKFSQAVDPPAREYGLMRDTGRHDTSRFVGSASGIHFIRGVYLRLSRKSASRAGSAAGINHLVPGEDDQLQPGRTSRDGGQQYLWKEHEVASEAASTESWPSFELLVTWSRSYFQAWHPTLPFLSAPEVLAIFEKVSNSGISSVSHLEQSILRSVFSISLADSRQSAPFSEPLPPSLVFNTIEEAMSASQFALYQPASLHATQAALSIQLFLMSMLRLNAASRLGGLIVRMAFHLGLHRCPSRYPFFTKQEAHIRRRVFWSIYCNERFLSQSLGLPLDIKDDDVDVCYPGEEIHSTHVETEDNRLQLLTYLSKHARIRGLILELRNKSVSSRDDTPTHESYVQAEMARWSNEIHDALEDEDGDGEQPGEDNTEPALSPGHRIYLSLLKFESKISLNRPMMASDPSSGSYCAGLQNCIFAARSILIALKKHQSRHKTKSKDGNALSDPILWPTITGAIWISSFILIYAASERQLPLSSALRHVEAGKDMLRHIAARETAWPEYCLSAIDELTAANGADNLFFGERNHDSRPLRNDHGEPLQWRQPAGSTTSPLNPDAWQMRAPQQEPGGPGRTTTSGLGGEQMSATVAGGPFALPQQDLLPGEGQESMVWYDQLFANSLGAIDYPYMAAAQFDSSIDPTWSYLR